jgi:predicted PurR-regulated permease PerM
VENWRRAPGVVASAPVAYQSSPSSPGLTPSRYYSRAFGLATTAFLGYLLYLVLSPFQGPIIWASLLAFMLQPVQRRLLRRVRSKTLAAGLLTGGTFVVVAGPLTLFGIALLQQGTALLARFQAEAHDRNLPALQLLLQLGPVQAVLERTRDLTALSSEQILQQASDAIQRAAQQLASVGGTLVVGAFTTVTQFAFTLFLLFFFLRDGERMLERGLHLVPMAPLRKEELARQLGGVTRGVVLGTLATALVQGSLLGLGFGIFGMPSPLVFAAVGALTSLIPIIGTSLVWVPAVITLVAQGNTGTAVLLTLWCVVLVAGSDNVVRPLIISNTSDAPTLLIFTGLLGGVTVFGVAGIFLGPLLLTLVATLLRYADELAPLPRRPSEVVADKDAPA